MSFRRSATNPQGPTGDFDGDIKVSNKPPSKADLQNVAKLPVLDASGKSHTFESLYNGKYKVLIIFIRHFFCGNCQEYLRTLASVLTPESLKTLPTPTEIVVVGCGQPDLIPGYIKETECPFPIYADPTKKALCGVGHDKDTKSWTQDPRIYAGVNTVSGYQVDYPSITRWQQNA